MEKAAQVEWFAWHEPFVAIESGNKTSCSQLSIMTTQQQSVLFAQLSKMAVPTPPSPTPKRSSKLPTIFFLP